MITVSQMMGKKEIDTLDIDLRTLGNNVITKTYKGVEFTLEVNGDFHRRKGYKLTLHAGEYRKLDCTVTVKNKKEFIKTIEDDIKLNELAREREQSQNKANIEVKRYSKEEIRTELETQNIEGKLHCARSDYDIELYKLVNYAKTNAPFTIEDCESVESQNIIIDFAYEIQNS